jgi:aryl-alcohol dehydrogenase-like predicted oxidoreductase
MANRSSRRAFLASGLALPAAVSANQTLPTGGRPAPAEPPPPAGQMVYSDLGRTGLKVSRLGIGGSARSDPSVLDLAYDMGVNFFDTARSNDAGNTERMLGAAFKSKRQRVVISTKTTAKSKDEALRDLEASLRELGSDYIDIWYMQARNVPADISSGLFEAQRLAKQQGKIRFAGVSMHLAMNTMIRRLIKIRRTDVILAAYNFTMPPAMDMEKSVAAARAAGIGMVVMKTMAGGFARIERGDLPYAGDREALIARLKKPGAMVSALKWALRNKNVEAAVVGVLTADQLVENVAGAAAPFTGADSMLLGIAERATRAREIFAC